MKSWMAALMLLKWISLFWAAASGELCAPSGGSPVEISLTEGLQKLNFFGVDARNVFVNRKVGDPRVVITNYSGAVSHTVSENSIVEIRVEACASTTPSSTASTIPSSTASATLSATLSTALSTTPAGGNEDDVASAAAPRPMLYLPAMALMAVSPNRRVAALFGGVLAATMVSGVPDSCSSFVTVDIYTPAAPAAGPSTSACKQGSLQDPGVPKQSIFDSPTKDEMLKIVEAFKSYDLGSCDGGIVGNSLRVGESALKFTPAPLPKPDRSLIAALFDSSSLATTSLASSSSAVWGGIMMTYFSRIDVMWPPKEEALAYLDGSGARPGRYAKVNVAFGQCATPYFKEYKVGPLDGTIQISPIPNGNQPWGSRPREGNEMRALKTMVDIILNEPDFKTLTTESFGGVHGDVLNNHEPAPPGTAADERMTQILINYAIKGTWRGKDLALVPLSFTIDNTNGDPSMWVAKDFYYNKQGPFTRDDLISKYKDGTLEKVVMPATWKDDIQTKFFPARQDRTQRANADIPGPKTFMPAGNRFTVNGRTIKWMDWEFHAGYNFRSGTSFHDIKFKGQRIAYEMSLSEVLLVYSADDPVASNVIFFDATFGNGEYREMMRGIDCPDYATYIDNYWWAAPGGAQDAKRATCIYEHWSGAPIWRRGGPFVSGLKDETLVVRTVLTNGNYDYACTFTFDLGGQIRVDLTSSGFLQTHWLSKQDAAENSMSYRIHDYAGGSLHDHTYGFKIDFDVGGEKNTFQTIKYKWADTKTALNEGRAAPYSTKPAYALWSKMRYAEKHEHAKETTVNVDPMNPGSWLFGDISQKNKWGNPRMYRLKVNDAHAVANVPDDHVTMPASSFSKQFMAVTRYKEGESGLSGDYDLNRLADPQVSLANYINGESIAQEDLVAWVALSTIHLPHSEDVPMTNNIQHGVTLTPWNFFDENPTMDMPNYHRMMVGEVGEDVATMRGNADEPTGETCVPEVFGREMEFNGVF